MTKFKIPYKIIFGVFITWMCLSSCELESLEKKYGSADEVFFQAFILEDEDEINTREFVDNNVTSQIFDCNFYIDMDVTDETSSIYSETGVYHIGAGSSGRLTSKTPGSRLTWNDKVSEHYFNAFTVPWKDQDTYMPEEDEITFSFEDSGLGNDFDRWENNVALERLVSATGGPYIYEKDGMYVPLTFKHLVSKIRIKSLKLIDVAGASHSDIVGNITLLGIPKTAILNARPDKEKELGKRSDPYVSFPSDFKYDQEEGVKFAIKNDGNDYLYVCPEIDFSNVNFQIDVLSYNSETEEWETSKDHGSIGSFYGTFAGITLPRKVNTDYDIADGSDATVLHAGELMEIEILLYEKSSAGMGGITVKTWPSYKRDGYHHLRHGIYSNDEIADLVTAFNKTKPSDVNSKEYEVWMALMEEIYMLYGEGFTDGNDTPEFPEAPNHKGILHLYEDVSVTGSSFPMNDLFILDGNGYTMKFSSLSSTRVKIGQVKDVYLEYKVVNAYGQVTTHYILYIDNDGKIFKVDPETGDKTNLNKSIPDYAPFWINLNTGAITKP
ncbi:MAG: hypothetical protein J1F67_11360 [Muribaculaceae bacterium]|nr:hypothetical protein [Muribaculaceae bacterium]